MDGWRSIDASEGGRKEVLDGVLSNQVGGCSCEVEEGSVNLGNKVYAACERGRSDERACQKCERTRSAKWHVDTLHTSLTIVAH